MPDRYPGAIWHPSSINHPMRQVTWGITVHWTVGREAGDVSVLDGPSVDCQFYVAKDGDVYQFLDPDSCAWTAKETANRTCVQIETEGRGEPWTPVQLHEMAKLCAWLCRRYAIPVRHVDPRPGTPESFRGLFGHRDLSNYPAVDSNDHTDTVPDGTGWDTFLAAIREEMSPMPTWDPPKAELPPASATVDQLIDRAMSKAVVAREQFESIGRNHPDLNDYAEQAYANAQGALNDLAALRHKV